MARSKHPDADDVAALLAELTETQDMVAALQVEYEEMREAAITPAVRAELEAIDAELGERLRHGRSRAETLTARIKEAVVEIGDTVKGGRQMAVFNEGRVSVDVKGLEGYAVAHPEVRRFIKRNKPYVTLRWLKEPVKKGAKE